MRPDFRLLIRQPRLSIALFALLCLGGLPASAVTEANPYAAIAGRNVFALKPPTPVATVDPSKNTPPPNLELQGFSTILGRPQVLIKIKFPPRPPEPASRARPDAPAWLESVLLRALAPRPADRFASMQDLLSALESRRTVVRSAELEAVSGLDRYDLARQFRAVHGTSPYRFSVLRRLDYARGRLGDGTPLAELALDAGFTDQAHFTRMFRSAFGLTPGRYLALRRGAASPSSGRVRPR